LSWSSGIRLIHPSIGSESTRVFGLEEVNDAALQQIQRLNVRWERLRQGG
jgi:hypothetical protein